MKNNSGLHVMLPPDLKARLDIILYSDLEGRVPKGAYKEFLTNRLVEYFHWQRLDLSPYGFPKGYYIVGQPEILEALIPKLEKKQ